MHYLVRIPATNEADFDHAITVEAQNWMSALRAALIQVGREPSIGLFADIQTDRTVRVFDSPNQAVYDIELVAVAEESPSDTLEMSPTERLALMRELRSEERPAQLGVALTPELGTPRVVESKRSPSGSMPAVKIAPGIDETIVETVLLEISWAWEEERTLQEVSARILDLALRLIPSESGAVLYPGLQGRELYFAVARGPKSEEVAHHRLPIDQGIAGFCLREAVALAVQDVERDARFYDTIARAIDYMPRNALCAPVQVGSRVFGVIELLNADATGYSMADVSVLAHMGQQLGQYINGAL